MCLRACLRLFFAHSVRALLRFSSEPAPSDSSTVPSDVHTATEHIVTRADGLFLYCNQILHLLSTGGVVRYQISRFASSNPFPVLAVPLFFPRPLLFVRRHRQCCLPLTMQDGLD